MSSQPSLPDKVEAIHAALAQAKIPHAFGGALALAYYAEPRATVDIDVNVFVAPEQGDAVREALAPLGVGEPSAPMSLARDGQCRLWWGDTPVDLFFAYADIHQAMRRAARLVPFGDARIPVLSPEHLVVCKAAFDRPKDWIDIEQILVDTGDLDRTEIADWLTQMLGDEDARTLRFDKLVRSRKR